MKLNLHLQKEYESIKTNIYLSESELEKYKTDDLYLISSDKETYTSYLEKLNLNNIKLKDLLDEKMEFILNNTRMIEHHSGDPLYKFNDNKIFVTIEQVSNEEKLFKILGSIAFYISGSMTNERKKVISDTVVYQISYLITKIGFRPTNTEMMLDQIIRYTTAIIDINLGKNLEHELKNDLSYNNVSYNNDNKYLEFYEMVKDWNTEKYFEELSKLIGLDSTAFKQIFASKYGINSIMVFEDISNYFLILFLSYYFKIKEVLSSYILSNDKTSNLGQRMLNFMTYHFNSIR